MNTPGGQMAASRGALLQRRCLEQHRDGVCSRHL